MYELDKNSFYMLSEPFTIDRDDEYYDDYEQDQCCDCSFPVKSSMVDNMCARCGKSL